MLDASVAVWLCGGKGGFGRRPSWSSVGEFSQIHVRRCCARAEGGFRKALAGMGFISALCRHKFPSGTQKRPQPVAGFVFRVSIFSHSFSFSITWYRSVLAGSRGGRSSAFGPNPACGVGVRRSVTPDGGVWRKFFGENFQALDAHTDFIPASGVSCWHNTGAGFSQPNPEVRPSLAQSRGRPCRRG